MNIIEAIQAAENGKLITNSTLKLMGCFLKYIRGGVFYQYVKLPDGHTEYKYEVREFSMGDVLNISWEISDAKINPK